MKQEDGCAEEDGREHEAPQLQVPDGGYGWVIVTGGFLITLMSDSHTRLTSLFFAGFVDKFQQSAAASAAVIAMMDTVRMFSSLLGSVIATKFSHRAGTILAGLLHGIAFLTTAFAPNLSVCYITYSFIGGIALGIAYTLSVAAVGMYFDKKRGKASAIMSIGTEIGIMTIAPLMQYLTEKYSFDGMCIILAGIMLNVCVAGALYRPLILENPNKIHSKFPQNETLNSLATAVSMQSLGSAIVYTNTNEKKYDTDNCSPSKGNLGTKNQKEFGSGMNNLVLSKETNQKCHTFDIGLIRDIPFMGFVIFMMFTYMTVGLTTTLISSLAKEKGLTDMEISLMFVIGAAVSIPFRIFIGVIADWSWVRRHEQAIFCLCCAFTAVFTGTLTLANTVIEMTILWCVYVMFMVMTWLYHIVILIGLSGPLHITAAIGIERPFLGLGGLISFPLGGHVKDITGSYVWPFVGICSVYLLIVLLYATFLVIYHYWHRKPRTKHHNEIKLNVNDKIIT